MKGVTRAGRNVRPMVERLEERRLLDSAGWIEGAVLPSRLSEFDYGWMCEPPANFTYLDEQPAGGDDALGAGITRLISGVPEYIWYNGCGPTAGGMVFGYWDQLAYPNYFAGDATTQTASVNAGIASAGHIADYAPTPDAPLPHHADDSLADFMQTSRDPQRFGWSRMSDVDDGMIGYADFRGYSASHAWNETFGAGLTWSTFTAEIDAGRPLVFLVDSDASGGTDHFVPVFGYRTDPSNQYAVYTTWASQPGVRWFDWEQMAPGQAWGIYGATFFHPSWGQPDLAATSSNVSPEPLRWDDAFNYSYTVKNFGSASAAASTVRFYLSSNSTISSSDYLLGSATLGSIGAGSSVSGVRSLSLPATPPTGFTMVDDVWIGMIVDAAGTVAEGVENNNSNLGEFKDFDRVSVSADPDLRGTSFSLDPAVLNLGSVTADFRVENAGYSSSGGFYVRFYLSSNSTISTGDTYLGERYVSSLAPGGAYTGSITLTPPGTDPFGTGGKYYVGMVVDYDNRVAESNETNNANRGLGVDKAEASYGRRIFFADFEHGDGAMNVVNDTAWAPVDGLWHLSTRRGRDAGHTSSHSMYYGVEKLGHYDVGDSAGVFYTKQIELPDEPVALTFNYFSEVEASLLKDRIRVQVYDPDTGVYSTVLEKGSGLLADTGGLWREGKADLSAFRGRSVRLRFTFLTDDALNNEYEGWYVDDIALWAATNPTNVENFRSLSRYSDLYYEPSYLNWAADHDTFVVNEEQTDGTFTIRSAGHSTAVHPAIAVYDYETGEMLYMDGDTGADGYAEVVLANSGYWNSYLVEVWDVEEDTTGELDVHVEGVSDLAYSTVTLDNGGDGTRTGVINTSTDTDYYRLVAPPQASGDLTVRLVETTTGLRTRLQIWKGDNDTPLVALSDENDAEVANLSGVQPGDVYWVAVSDHDFSGLGNFELSVDFSTALPGLMITAEGFAYFHRDGISHDTQTFSTFSGSANIAVGDIDSFFFAGDTGWTGTYTIRVERLSGSVDPVVAVYDADTGAQVGFDDDSGGGVTALLSLTLSPLKRYIVAVTDDNSTETGDVSIVITAPGTGTMYTMAPDAAGHAERVGSDYIGTNDTDFYRFTAPADADGSLTVRVDPAATLDAVAVLFDAAGNELGRSYTAAAGVDETISVTGLVPGTTYYLSVLGKDYETTGSFDVYVDFGLCVPLTINPADAHFSWLTPNQFGYEPPQGRDIGAGELPGELIAIRPEATGPIIIDVSNTVFNSRVALYSSAGNRLAWAAEGAGGVAHLEYAGTGAATYYVFVTSQDNLGTGSFTFTADVPSFTAATVTVNPATGDYTINSAVSPIPDQDYYSVKAPLDATQLRVTMTPTSGGLVPTLRIYDAAGARLAYDHPIDSVAESLQLFSITPGATYVIGCGSVYYTSGNFTLDVDFTVVGDLVPGAPKVSLSRVNDGGVARSRIFSCDALFNEPVDVVDGGLVLYNTTTSSLFVVPIGRMSYDVVTRRARWNLAGLGLTDGDYIATLDADAVSDAPGLHLDGNGDGTPGDDYTFTFHQLAGDIDGDRTTGLADLAILATNWNQSGNQDKGDLDGDGSIGLADLAILATHWNDALASGGQADAPAAVDGAATGVRRTVRDRDEASGNAALRPATRVRREGPSLARPDLVPDVGVDLLQLARA